MILYLWDRIYSSFMDLMQNYFALLLKFTERKYAKCIKYYVRKLFNSENILNQIANYMQIIQSSAFIDISTQNIHLRIRVKLLQLLGYSINSSPLFDIAYDPGFMAFYLFVLYQKAGRVLTTFSFPRNGKRTIYLSKVKEERMTLMRQRFNQNVKYKIAKLLLLHFFKYSWHTILY